MSVDPRTSLRWNRTLDKSPDAGVRAIFTDEDYLLTNSLWGASPILAALCDPGKYHLFRDDFNSFNEVSATGQWATIEGDTGSTVGMADAANGVLDLDKDATDEDEVYIHTINDLFLPAAGKPIWFECGFTLDDASTPEANLFFGLVEAPVANLMKDAGAGPLDTYDGACVFAIDGGTVFQGETSNASTQVTNTDIGAKADNTFTRVGFHIDGAATAAVVTYYLDGVPDSTTGTLVLSGLVAMSIAMGMKGGGTTALKLKLDYVQCLQVK